MSVAGGAVPARRAGIVSISEVADRLSRDQFLGRLASLDQPQLRKLLWTVYWRGTAATRARIEAELDSIENGTRPRPVTAPPIDAQQIRRQVTEFGALARAGAYLAGDRRVSPKQRTRWRYTFKQLAVDVQRALRDPDPEPGAAALEQLIDLACEMRDYDYFRSQDPVEAAGFVVSDATALLWTTLLDRYGFPGFAKRAAPQLIRWESRYGWTRTGDGRTAQQESSLAAVLARLLRLPDMWSGFADAYLAALDDTANTPRRLRRGRAQRSEELAEWHQLLLDHLTGTDAEDRLDRLAHHPTLGGPEHRYLQAQLARQHGDLDTARTAIQHCLDQLPGHPQFRQLATEINAALP